MPAKKRHNKSQTEVPSAEKKLAAKKEPTVPEPLRLELTVEARTAFLALKSSDPTRFGKVAKALRLLAENPRYPGLNSHEYRSKKGPNNEKLWESYVENNTPAAYRLFWYYGPEERTITVIAVTPHP